MDLTTITELRAGTGPSVDGLPAWQPGDLWLAGGTWVFSEPQRQARRLLDLTTLGWAALEHRDGAPGTDPPDGEGLVIGATCTIAELYAAAAGFAASGWTVGPLVRRCCEAFLASFKIWNVATVGGNLANALPAGPMIALTVALDGVATLWAPGGGVRSLPVADLVTGDGVTALQPGEVIRSVTLPAAALRSRTAVRQASLTTLGRSAALLVGRAGAGGFVLTVTGSTRRPVRVELEAHPDAETLAGALEAAIPAGLYHDDVHGHPAWRRHLTFRLAEELRAELAS